MLQTDKATVGNHGNLKLPAHLVLTSVSKGDAIHCQITSKPYSDSAAVTVAPGDFNKGNRA